MINFDLANVSECRKYDLLIFCEFIFGGPTRGQNGGLRSQLSGLRSRVSGLRSQVSGLRSQVPGLRSQVSGLRSQVSGLGSRVSGLRSQVSGPRSLVLGLRSQVLGPWVSLGCPWDSLGVLTGVYGVHRRSLGHGSGNPEVLGFLQPHRPSPRNLLDHDLSAWFISPWMIGEKHLHALTHNGSADL